MLADRASLELIVVLIGLRWELEGRVNTSSLTDYRLWEPSRAESLTETAWDHDATAPFQTDHFSHYLLSVCLSVSVSLSVSMFLTLSLDVSVSVSVLFSFSLSLSLLLSLLFSLCRSPSVPLSLCLPLSPPLSPPPPPPLQMKPELI